MAQIRDGGEGKQLPAGTEETPGGTMAGVKLTSPELMERALERSVFNGKSTGGKRRALRTHQGQDRGRGQPREMRPRGVAAGGVPASHGRVSEHPKQKKKKISGSETSLPRREARQGLEFVNAATVKKLHGGGKRGLRRDPKIGDRGH